MVRTVRCGSRTSTSIGRIDFLGAVTTFPAPGITSATGIALGPDGNLWFTDAVDGGGTIGRITAAGVVTTFTSPKLRRPDRHRPRAGRQPRFTNHHGNSIGRVTPGGVISKFSDPSISGPSDIAVGQDGQLWFTNRVAGGGSVGRISVAGVVSTFSDPRITEPVSVMSPLAGDREHLRRRPRRRGAHRRGRPGRDLRTLGTSGVKRPARLVQGPDGGLWSTNQIAGGGAIMHHDQYGWPATYTDPALDAPTDITVGPDGNLWFTNHGTKGSIGRITPSGTITTFTDPRIHAPSAITTGADGNLWFANEGSPGGSLTRLTTSGQMTFYAAPGVDHVTSMVDGPLDRLWWTSSGNDRIGWFDPVHGVQGSFTDASVHTPTGIAVGGDGALWFTNAGGPSIGRMTAAGAVSTFSSGALHHPSAITASPAGDLWFSDDGSIDRITVGGTITAFPSSSVDGALGLAWDDDGSVWMANQGNSTLAHIDAVTAPTLPRNPVITVHAHQVVVTWDAPSSDGGGPIDSYLLRMAPDSSECVWRTGPLTCTFDRVGAGSHTITIMASNGQGSGPVLGPIDVTVLPVPAPRRTSAPSVRRRRPRSPGRHHSRRTTSRRSRRTGPWRHRAARAASGRPDP